MKLINIWFLQRAAQLHRVLLLRYQAAMLQLRVLVLTQCPAGQLTLLSTSTILLLQLGDVLLPRHGQRRSCKSNSAGMTSTNVQHGRMSIVCQTRSRSTSWPGWPGSLTSVLQRASEHTHMMSAPMYSAPTALKLESGIALILGIVVLGASRCVPISCLRETMPCMLPACMLPACLHVACVHVACMRRCPACCLFMIADRQCHQLPVREDPGIGMLTVQQYNAIVSVMHGRMKQYNDA